MASDWFVGGVAFTLALMAAIAAWNPWPAAQRFWLARHLETRYGHGASRGLYLCAAILLAILSVLIVSGTRPLVAPLNFLRASDSAARRP
jgi:hypothetical protein